MTQDAHWVYQKQKASALSVKYYNWPANLCCLFGMTAGQYSSQTDNTDWQASCNILRTLRQ